MTTYSASAVSNTVIAFKKSITLQLLRALRDNTLAIAEGDSTAPANAASWLDYTGAETLTPIYDSGVSGAVANVVSPNFEDGWEYQFLFYNVTTSGGTTDDFQVDFYRQTGAAYSGPTTIVTDVASSIKGFLAIHSPRLVLNAHTMNWALTDAANTSAVMGAAPEAGNGVIIHTSAQKILKVRFSFVTGNINGGKIFMLRRQMRATI